MISNLVGYHINYAREGNLTQALKLFSLIKSNASKLVIDNMFLLRSISHLLQHCASHELLLEAKQLHAHLILLGFENHLLIVPKLVTIYFNCNLFSDALAIAENAGTRNPLSWNIFISSCVKHKKFQMATSAFRQMVCKGIQPDGFTYPSVLKACGETMDLGLVRRIHETILSSSRTLNLYVHNSLLSAYGKLGELGLVRKLFDTMPDRDGISWNAMITAYASNGMLQEAIQLFDDMLERGIEANTITWNTILGGHLQVSKPYRALDLLSEMKTIGVHIDAIAAINGLCACSHIGALQFGKQIHGLVILTHLDATVNVKNSLISMYSKCGDMHNAYTLFRLTKNKDVITWNSLLSGFADMELYDEVLFLFKEMLVSGVELSCVTMATVLPLCAQSADLQHGMEFHSYIIRRAQFSEHVLLLNALVEMYSRCSHVTQAEKVFKSMNRRDKITYTSLITGYGIQGNGHLAIDIFNQMLKEQIKPDQLTITAVLSACSHSGLINEGRIIFENMQSSYGIPQGIEHFSCMVDLYGRAGFLDKALDIILTMPHTPNPGVWATLLSACHVHGNTELGELAAEKLFETKPKRPGYCVLIANMYAAAGSWNKLAHVRAYMRDLGLRKDPGCAWIDVGFGFHPFFVSFPSKPQHEELYHLLASLMESMRDTGFVANNDFEGVN